jgi:pyruvate dehydrogenase E1 component alpha subunit
MAQQAIRSEHLGIIPDLERTFPKEFSLELFRRANFSHQYEKKVAEAWEKKLFAIPIYLSLGTEYNAAAFSLVCKDWRIFAQHRGHSTYLSFGGKPEALRDELLGLPTGCSGGMSGSNAIQGREIKMYGHSGLMGEQVPIACGAAYASRQPCLTICGDASVEEDYIYPSLGWAATEKLPVLFVCEDNDLSILTKVEARRNWSPVEVAKGIGITAVDITDDPWLIAHHVQQMSKNMPGFINIRSVRVLWHSGPGVDGAPEWDRYKITNQKLINLGLKSEMDKIEADNKEKVNSIWQSALSGK